MKKLLVLALIGSSLSISAQKAVKQINKQVKQITYESHLRFLASDELRGRNTGTIENEIAARYIANQLQKFGV
ncbi:MAG: hypothetical protein RIA69_05430, partial [Cyclobacteriaceae bacterium]